MLSDPFLKIFIALLVYTLTLLILRARGWKRKEVCNNCNNCCPDCKAALNRIKRTKIDKLYYSLTFRIFDFKRYTCDNCGWEGLRWEKKYTRY